MRALVFHQAKKVSVDTVDDPIIEKQDDIIVKVSSTAICGSDLYIYNGLVPQKKPFIMGHEFMGIIEETGKDIKLLKKGDRVVVPFPIACGHCFFCNHGLTPHCDESNPNYGPEGGMLKQKGGALFGFTDLYGGYPGGQAEYVRVPYANFSPRKIEPDMSDEELLFLTDIFPTGWSAIDWAQLKGGETVVVFGCGPVGIMAQKAAWLKGAGRVIAVDTLDYRLEIAAKTAKSETLNHHTTDVIQEIRDRTKGRGADVCVDAVGMEGGNLPAWKKILNLMQCQVGSVSMIKLCASAVRRGGVISVIGVYGTSYNDFPFGQIFDKGITIYTGPGLVHHYIDELLELVQDRKVILNDIISHSLPLEQAAYGYDLFSKKKDNCLKVILKP